MAERTGEVGESALDLEEKWHCPPKRIVSKAICTESGI